MTITTASFKNGFGAEIIGVDFSEPISDDDMQFISDAFDHHHILTFRGYDGLSTDQVLAASRLFGKDLESHVFAQYHHPDDPLVMVLSNRVKGSKPAGLKDAGTFWHSDVAYKPEPARATLLYSLEVPDHGGDTLFCDLTAAYDDLSDEMKVRLDGHPGAPSSHQIDHRRLRLSRKIACLRRGQVPQANRATLHGRAQVYKRHQNAKTSQRP